MSKRKQKRKQYTKFRRYAPFWLRLQILERDGYRCRYCGKSVTRRNANIDHVKPWRLGGRTVEDNLVTACQDCNKLKLNRRNWTPESIEDLQYFGDFNSDFEAMESHMKSI